MTQIAQFLWVSGKLSRLENACLRSHLKAGYDTHLYTYGEVTNIPSGVRVLDARDVLCESFISLMPGVSGLSYASFSDVFRYHLLAKKGGWWFDMDTLAIKVMQVPSQSLYVASTWEGSWGECATNCAIYSAKNNPFASELAEKALEIYKAGNVNFGSLGPFLLQSYIKERQLQNCVAPWQEFCPMPWRLTNMIASQTLRDLSIDYSRYLKHKLSINIQKNFRGIEILSSTRSIHLHNEIWRSNQIDKNAVFHRNSFYEIWLRKYAY